MASSQIVYIIPFIVEAIDIWGVDIDNKPSLQHSLSSQNRSTLFKFITSIIRLTINEDIRFNNIYPLDAINTVEHTDRV